MHSIEMKRQTLNLSQVQMSEGGLGQVSGDRRYDPVQCTASVHRTLYSCTGQQDTVNSVMQCTVLYRGLALRYKHTSGVLASHWLLITGTCLPLGNAIFQVISMPGHRMLV